MVGWIDAEGGHWHNTAKYNPLNTTQSEPGAGNTGTQGNIKVYRDWKQGIDATVATLKNGNYGNILSALKRGDANAVAHAIGSSPWGTSGDLVARTIGSTGPIHSTSGSSSHPGSTQPSSTRQVALGTLTRTVPGKSFADQRAALQSQKNQGVVQFLGNKNADILDFALQQRGYADQIAQLKDVPSRTVPIGPASATVPGSDGTSIQGTGSASEAAARANVINAQHLPYEWGGGHAGKTALRDPVPLDCSGAVSKVLGIDPRVSGQFASWGSPGDGGNHGVTIYSNSHHVLMKIDGHFFGTSATNPGGGAGWIKQSAISPSYLKGFTARHAA